MARFLVDVNLPHRFSLWKDKRFQLVRDLGEDWNDSQIWGYARDRDLIIVTKDADVSDRIMVSRPPPRVVHIKLGNLRIRKLHAVLNTFWPRIEQLSETNRLVQVFDDRIEAIE